MGPARPSRIWRRSSRSFGRLGQVVVFVDEADQVAGRRGEDSGDSGLSGRVYGMLAKEMSETRNRGKILWVFATSRPDLLEVDSSARPPGRPHSALSAADARGAADAPPGGRSEAAIPAGGRDLPDMAGQDALLWQRSGRVLCAWSASMRSAQSPRGRSRICSRSAQGGPAQRADPEAGIHGLGAVRECTDARFLPPQFRGLPPEDVERQIRELQAFAG